MKWTSLLILLYSCTALADGPVARLKDLPWSDPVNGLAASFEVWPREKYHYHPGERFLLSANLKNVGNLPLHLPRSDSGYTRYFVRLPSGKVLTATRRELLGAPGEGDLEQIARDKLKSLESYDDGWIDKRLKWKDPKAPENATGPDISFRVPGEYEFWMEYTVPAGRQPRAWRGTLRSLSVKVTLSELPPEKRLLRPTPEQFKLVERAQVRHAEKAFADWQIAHGQLDEELKRTENEGLAMLLVSEADRMGDYGLYRPVIERCLFLDGNHLHLGIDGPAFKALAHGIMSRIERDPDATENWHRTADTGPITFYLRAHTDPDLRKRAREYGLKHARLAENLQEKDWGRLSTAWNLLFASGDLKNGMTLQSAIAIVGKPTDQDEQAVAWYYNKLSRVELGLDALIRDGKLYFYEE